MEGGSKRQKLELKGMEVQQLSAAAARLDFVMNTTHTKWAVIYLKGDYYAKTTMESEYSFLRPLSFSCGTPAGKVVAIILLIHKSPCEDTGMLLYFFCVTFPHS